MSYAPPIDTVTWPVRARSPKAWDTLGFKRTLARAFQGDRGYAQTGKQLLGAALGASSPGSIIAGLRQEHEFAAAFNLGAELAADMAAADEADPADPEIWGAAFDALSNFARFLPAPLVSPLQLGGLSIEWHEVALNIELRFRGLTDIYTVIEDARRELATFQGHDVDLRRAENALRTLAARTR
jgi:hypothetical protein